jgi:GGDEF domain-containing protein
MLGRQHAQGSESAIGHPALTDPQTGLANRLHFELFYSYLFGAGDRGMMFTVMLLSVGGPDQLSESRVRALGQTIERTTRTSDLVAHVGGGRYVVLLLGTNLQGARIAADRVENALRDMAPGPVCFGIAAFRPRMKESSELLEAADSALAAAEAAGGGLEFA